MDRNKSNEPGGSCYAWFFRVKKSVSERLARIRNSLRRRLAKKNPLAKPLTPDDLENETGSPDLIITRVLVGPRQTPSPGEITSAAVTGEVTSPLPGVCDIEEPTQFPLQKMGYIGCTEDGTPDLLQVKDFVRGIIRSAEEEVYITQAVRVETPRMGEDTASLTSSILSIMANEAVKQSLTTVVQEMAEETKMTVSYDAESLSSGAISDLAEAAVTESLTKIINDSNDNYNYSKVLGSKTAPE